ncbi:hypothetical protein Tco_0569169 [Tanacetum coccineum]
MKDSLKHSLESNLKRIQLKDIVKKVEDYLKTYLSAGMDISWYVDGIHLRFKERNNNRVENAFETNNANNNGTNNATTNVVGEDLPQLLDYWVAHFLQKDCPTTKTSSPSYPSSNKIHNKTKFRTNSFSSSHQHNQTVDNVQKDYKVRYKALKVELDLLTQKIENSSKQKSEKGLVDESFNWDEKSLSSEDEGTTTVKAFMAIAEDDPMLEKLMQDQQVLGNIFRALGGRGKQKDMNSSQDVVFIKDEDSPIENSPECAFDTKYVNDNHDPVPPLPKLSRADPFGTPKGVTSIDLAQTYIVSDKTKKLSYIDKMLDQGGYNNAALNQRSTLMKELHDLYSIKALEDAQKAKVQWFIEVDGEWLAYPSTVKSEFLKHFENRFSKLESSRITLDYHFPNRLSFEKTKELEHNNLIDQDMVATVNEFSMSATFPQGCNSSFIALIRKAQDAKVVIKKSFLEEWVTRVLVVAPRSVSRLRLRDSLINAEKLAFLLSKSKSRCHNHDLVEVARAIR